MPTTAATKKTPKPLHPKAAREALGLSKEKLAELVPCALTTVYVCEDRKEYPKRGKALRDAYLKAVKQDPESLAKAAEVARG